MQLRSKDGELAEARERATRAICELCEERGYAETGVEEICERAGIDRASFEELFGDKEGCLGAAIREIIGEVMMVVSTNYSADRSEWDSALASIAAILDSFAASPPRAYAAYMTSRLARGGVQDEREAIATLLAAMLERLWGQAAPKTRPPAGAGRAASGGAEAVLRRELAAGRGAALPSLLPSLAYGATVPFLGQEEALRLARRGQEMLADTPWA